MLCWCGVGTLGRAAGESLVIVWTWDDGTDLMIFHLLFLTRGPRRGAEEIQTEIEVYHNPPEEGVHTVLKTNVKQQRRHERKTQIIKKSYLYVHYPCVSSPDARGPTRTDFLASHFASFCSVHCV